MPGSRGKKLLWSWAALASLPETGKETPGAESAEVGIRSAENSQIAGRRLVAQSITEEATAEVRARETGAPAERRVLLRIVW